MNVLLLTQDGPIYMPRYLEPVLRARADDVEEIVLAPAGKGFRQEVSERYAMFGLLAFVRYGLMYAKGKTLDRLPTSLVYALTGRFYSVRALADEFDIPVRTVPDINDESFLDGIRARQPDLVLSIACGQKLGEDLLEAPERGAINVHGSLLPKYRGLTTSFWVLYHGEDESGVTAHYMTPEFDAGDIVLQRRYDVEPEDTMHDVYLKLIDVGADVAVEVIDAVEEGTIETEPNRTEDGEYYSRPTKEDRVEFLRRGNEFI